MRITTRGLALIVAGTLLVLASACTRQVNLSPGEWGEGELKKYFDIGAGSASQSGKQVEVTGKDGVVTGTSGALATHIGVEALRQGGSAIDAAIATSLAQITLTAGSAISFAGIFTMLYYDAETGQVHNLNAAWNTFQNELDPMSIPGMDLSALEGGNAMAAISSIEPSGRTAMVGGFMAGAGAAHERFGKLPWASLLEPSIYLAEQGIPVGDYLSRSIERQKRVISRLPETKAVFTKENGEFYQKGDTFRQTALAGTLREVALQGADYMYTGDWGQKFVTAVRNEGGKVTMKDMEHYEVLWSEPLHTRYGDYDIYGQALPANGGIHVAEALLLLEEANLRQYGDRHWESPEALYWFSQITDVAGLSYLTKAEREETHPGVDLSPASRVTKETAEWQWKQIESTNGRYPLGRADTGPRHSAAVVAIDQWGNIAAVVHSINTVGWGQTGIFVDGVSVPDAAWFQQKQIVEAGPGNRLPDPTNPTIVFKDGKPYMGSSSIGSSLHQQTVQGLYYMLEYGMTPNEAANGPAFMGAGIGGGAAISAVDAEFAPHVIEKLKAMGRQVNATPRRPRFWLAASIDPETGERLTTDAGVEEGEGHTRPLGLAEGH